MTHHTTMVAGMATVAAAAVNPDPWAILWGVAFGIVANYGAEWLSRVWTVHGHGFVDPPASIILVASALIWVLRQVNAFADRFVIPSAIVVLGVSYAGYVAWADRNVVDHERSVMEEQGLDRIDPEPLG